MYRLSIKIFLNFIVVVMLLYAISTFASVATNQSFGLMTAGGEGGKIIKVTNLNNHGDGSLRWALSQKGMRIIVFEVGGIIDLAKEGIEINQSFVTVAGQTAPDPGITLIRGGIKVKTNDVIIQHLMIRPGDNNEARRSGWESDGIAVSGSDAYNVHIDHCSLTWAIDENLSASGPRDKGHAATSHDIAFTNNIIAEALDNSTHIKGRHSKGLLVHDYVQNVAVVSNLFAHNDRRNPYFKGNTTGIVVNNLLYNIGNAAVQVGYIDDEYVISGLTPVNPRISVVGNTLIYGNSSYSDLPLVAYQGDVFMQNNTVVNLMGKAMPQTHGSIKTLESAPVWPQGLEVIAELQVKAHVLQNVGARPWRRDAIDQRIIDSVIQGNGQIIDSQNEVGGYPKYAATYRFLPLPSGDTQEWLHSFDK
jgi:hypothetical protein